jgi:hypothetical protein
VQRVQFRIGLMLRRARAEWAANQATLDPEHVLFLDETGTSTDMARLHVRAPRDERSCV